MQYEEHLHQRNTTVVSFTVASLQRVTHNTTNLCKVCFIGDLTNADVLLELTKPVQSVQERKHANEECESIRIQQERPGQRTKDQGPRTKDKGGQRTKDKGTKGQRTKDKGQLTKPTRMLLRRSAHSEVIWTVCLLVLRSNESAE